jgi:glycine betaine/proline transport system substrate-binding protein
LVVGILSAIYRQGGFFMKRIFSIITLSLLIFTGCENVTTTTTRGHIVMADAGWDSIRLHNAIVGFIAENAFELSWEEMTGSTPITYEALKNGDIDLYTEMWTDSIEPYYQDVEANVILELGVNYDDNAQGLYVPAFVVYGDAERGIEPMAPSLRTVQDLARYADVFKDAEDPNKGRIYGAIPGWNVDDIMRRKVTFNGLDEFYNYFSPGSDAALSAAFTSAYDRGEAMVGYYWEPTWLMGKYEFILLEDYPFNEDTYFDGEVAFPSVRVTIATRPNFDVDHPEFTQFLRQYQTSSAMTSEALAYMQDTRAGYSEVAIWFLQTNIEYLDKWLSTEKADIIRAALNK